MNSSNFFIRFCKDRSTLNLVIDLILLLLLMPMAGIGLMIKYVLLPGVQRNTRYGADVDLEFLGMDRHQWGTIHLIISITFLVFMILHIILHWKMIVCLFKRMIPKGNWQSVLAILIFAVSILLISFPLFIKPELVKHEPLFRHRTMHSDRSDRLMQPAETDQSSTSDDIPETDERINKKGRSIHTNPEAASHEHHRQNEEYEITGNLTLRQAAEKYSVPLTILCKDLKIHENLAEERLGRLRKKYPFTMSDVRESIGRYKAGASD